MSAPKKHGIPSARAAIHGPDCECVIVQLSGRCPECGTRWVNGVPADADIHPEEVSLARAKFIIYRRKHAPPLGPLEVYAELQAAYRRGLADHPSATTSAPSDKKSRLKLGYEVGDDGDLRVVIRD